MKTIAIDIRLLGKKRTGDETVFFHLTRSVLQYDTQSKYLLLTTERDPGALAALAVRLGCVGNPRVEFVSLRGRNRFFWNLIFLPWYLIRHQIDVFHTQYILPLFIPSRTRVVTHIHDVSFCVYPEMISFLDRFFLGLSIPHTVHRSDVIVAPSEFTRSEIVRYYGIDSEKILVVPNAIGDAFLKKVSPEMILATRKKYHLPEKYVVVVGTLQPRKNIPFLLEAFARLRKRLPDFSLVLVGNRSGHHFDHGIDDVIAREGISESVVFPGYVDEFDLPAVVAGASLYAFPSLYEGFGIPILEAMSQGVPVAVSDTPCLREVALDAAVYFSPEDIASCEEILYNLAIDSSLKERLVLAGKNRVFSYSWAKSAQILCEEGYRINS